VVDPVRIDSVQRLAALPEPVKRAAEEFDEVDAPAGERIVSQGDFAYELFAILEGTARVEQDGEVVATLGTGSAARSASS
jgi:CRP-like cAMP-binding protein